ncbi:MAG: C_GCAxxG_C_C family protein [Candidatus Heimdallarchaeota archaeon]|nr:C_GCAxxG_C_C family protein [Candidatus Heimdallarchaeota archaeon]
MENKSKLINSANKMMEELRGNCAQAIFTSFGPQMGLENIDYELCMKIASAFGGGINLTGNVCGAITGTLMTLGLKYGGSAQEIEITRISNKIIEEFIALNGSIICRDIVGHDIFSNENLRKEFSEEIFKKCKKCVNDAACLLEKYI